MTMKQRCSEDENESEEIRKLIKEANEIVGKVSLSDNLWFCKNLDLQGFGKRCKKVHEKFDFVMEKTIKEQDEERKEEKGRCEKVKDLLDISDDKSSEIRVTRENIKASILEIFVARTDTSAITIEWALAELINHPDIMKKAREEINAVVGKTRVVEETLLTFLTSKL
ncbi:Cytochrome P450, E-class, group I [Parasponia andersonii]|uniref:Cytochrome P450, E-class, group I n=1 Tax=Parasponia andersonii TaxID=3476 RepID=A0A2P5ART7_PARAD|nr:Cytochrome P450, E-class, group I [Parasponia andersonii]